MGTMAVVITSVPTLLVASCAAAERASNSLQTCNGTHDKNNAFIIGSTCIILCKVHVKDCINLAIKLIPYGG